MKDVNYLSKRWEWSFGQVLGLPKIPYTEVSKLYKGTSFEKMLNEKLKKYGKCV